MKALVILLTLTMIVGVITVVFLLVTRMPRAFARLPPMPEAISLPDGTRAAAFTQGMDWYAVVTADDQILIFDRETGALKQTVKVGN